LVEQNDEVQSSRQARSLFSVTGRNSTGHTTSLIIAATKAVGEYHALHELGFVEVSATKLVSDAVYVVSALQTPRQCRIARHDGASLRDVRIHGRGMGKRVLPGRHEAA